MSKHFRNLIGSFILGGLLIAVTVKFWAQDINIDLSKTDQIIGAVTAAGVTEKSSTVSGRYKMKGSVFFLKLKNSNETFATYRPSQDYSKLTNNIEIGDIVSISYKQSNSAELNLDVYQIEKDGVILQDYDTYNKNHKALLWLTGIGGLGILFSGIYPFIKRKGQN